MLSFWKSIFCVEAGFALPIVTLRIGRTAGSITPPRFALSRCGLGAWPGRFRCVSGKNQSRCAGLGFSPSLRSKLPYGPKLRASRCHAAGWAHCRVDNSAALRAVTLRRLRNARLPSVSDLEQGRFASLRFRVLAPVHPRCSARLSASSYHASSPLFSGSTSSRALMPTSIMESSGSKVVKF